MDDPSRDHGPGHPQQSHLPSPLGAGPAGLPQAIAPGPPNNAAASAAANAAHSLSKRRRGLGVVTPNACTECRKKRAKCDGQRPCGRCKSQKDFECLYEVPVRQSKETLRTELEQLRHRQRSSDQVFAALVRTEFWEEIMQRLRSGQPVESISDWLGGSIPGGEGLAGFSRDATQGSTSSLAGFAGLGPGSIGGLSLGGPQGATGSPSTSQLPGMRTDMDQNSPWHFSSHSERSSSHPDLMNWTSSRTVRGPPQSRVGSWVDSTNPDGSPGGGQRYPEQGQRPRGLDLVLAPLEPSEMEVPAKTWTSITGDNGLVQHLLALYFCWEYPTFASLSKEHFLKDFQTGRHRFCSPILVNALLALGCRFSTQPNTRANPGDASSSGDHFFKETLRLFYLEEDHHRFTTIQALGIMSIREASCGRDSESWYYAGQSIRLAVEMGLHRISDEGDEDELAVQSATFWGAFALDHAWSLATGSLPQSSCFPHLPPKPGIIDDIEASLWIPYTDDGKLLSPQTFSQPGSGAHGLSPGAPIQRSCEQPSNVRSVYKCFCELSEIVHQSLYILHSPGRPLTSRNLLSIYTQYLDWYDRIPEVLRLGHNFTPAVLFTHMYYHFAILLLFRPLIKLKILGSSLSPQDVCSQAADAIQGLLRSYSQLYTLRRTPSFVPYFVLTSAIIHLAIGASGPSSHGPVDPMSPEPGSTLDPKVADAIKQGVEDLMEMAPCHGFAEQALSILRYLARKWHIEVDMGHGKPHDEPHVSRPYSSSLNFFAPSIREEDFMCVWGAGSSHSSSAAATATGHSASAGGLSGVAANSGDNPLFWPFPMQGKPVIPAGGALEEAGFELL